MSLGSDGTGCAGKVSLGLIVGIEPEKFVVNERAADAEAPLLAPVGGLVGNAVVSPRCRWERTEQRVGICRAAEVVVAVVEEQLAMQIDWSRSWLPCQLRRRRPSVLRGVIGTY